MKVVILSSPKRREHVEKILMPRFPTAALYEDTEFNGCVWNTERILADHPEGVLVVQDDVIAPEWFMEQVQASMLEGKAMSYFVGGRPWMRDLYDQGYSYVRRPDHWGACNYYPAWLCKGYTEWVKQFPAPTGHPFCYRRPMKGRKLEETMHLADVIITNYVRSVGERFYLTLPNLCQHGVLKSSIGNPTCNGAAWRSPVFGKALLRPWNKEAIYDSKK